MKIKPLNDRVIDKHMAEEEKTAGGIIIADTAKEKLREGRSCGCSCWQNWLMPGSA